MKTLVLGMGNPILCDDGVGLRLTAELRACSAACSDLVTISDCTVGGLNLLDVVAGFDRLIVLDSIKTAGGKPGSWYYFRGSSLQETMNLSNVHDANFATTLELGRRMGMKLPADDDIHVFAVEVADNLSFAESLTPELEEALPEVADEILAEVCELIAAPTDDCRNLAIGSACRPHPSSSPAVVPEEPTDP
jgi:hydrogenase maturation protease